MRQPLFLVAFVLTFAAAPALAAEVKAAPAELVEKPAVIVPLDVRDPSALVMTPYLTPGGAAAPAEALPPTPPLPPATGPWQRLEKNAERPAMPMRYRSVSVPVSGDALVDLRPGDRVDVISVFDALTASKSRDRLAATVLQNVKVLGTSAPKGEGAGAVLLMLNPVEAQMAALAVRQGSVAVSRREPGDDEIYPMEMSTYRKLFR